MDENKSIDGGNQEQTPTEYEALPSSSSSSTSSSSSPAAPRRHRKRSRKEIREADTHKLDVLANQVSDIVNFLKGNIPNNLKKYQADSDSETDLVSLHPAQDLRVSLFSEQPLLSERSKAKKLDFEVSTNLKEPEVNNSSMDRLAILNKLHHFDTKEWDRVRYVETEKRYVAKPGFYELDVNTELRYFDSNSNWLKLLDRSFGAMTHALVQQNDLLKQNFQQLIEWTQSPTTTLSADTLFEKIHSLFSEKSPYMKVSEDLLQLICGRRADIIQRRRDCILSSVKDKYVKHDLSKIPPTNADLFNPQELGTFLQKAGGTNKLFAVQKRSAEEPHLMSMRNRQEGPRAKRPRRSFRYNEPEYEPQPSTSSRAATYKDFKGKNQKNSNNKGSKQNDKKYQPTHNRKSDRSYRK